LNVKPLQRGTTIKKEVVNDVVVNLPRVTSLIIKITNLRRINHVKGNVGIAIFNTHGEAENVVKELQKSGFDMKKLSIVGKDYHTEEQVVAYYNTGDRMKYWGKLGAFWGGLWGILFGAAFFWIPGIGPLVVAGPLVSAIVGALEVLWQLED